MVKEQVRLKQKSEIKSEPLKSLTLNDMPVLEWKASKRETHGQTSKYMLTKSRMKVKSVDEQDNDLPDWELPNPHDPDLRRDTASNAREVYATPTPAYNMPGLDPEPFANYVPSPSPVPFSPSHSPTPRACSGSSSF